MQQLTETENLPKILGIYLQFSKNFIPKECFSGISIKNSFAPFTDNFHFSENFPQISPSI